MTLLDAHEAARARWGSSAIVQETSTLGPDGPLTMRHVGRLDPEVSGWRELGRGRLWEDAFAAAERGSP